MDQLHTMIATVFPRAHNSIFDASFTILMMLSPTYQYSGIEVMIMHKKRLLISKTIRTLDTPLYDTIRQCQAYEGTVLLLYADTFGLVIDNFTMDKNGYYWCQILINDSFLNINPSQRAWFYAEESNSCVQGVLYYNTSGAQCALGKPVRNSNNKYYFNNYHSDHQLNHNTNRQSY